MAESTVLQPRTDRAANSQQQPPNAPVGPFKTSVAMAVRDFIGQQATPRQPVEINSASVDEFKEAVCLMARSHVIREVVVPDAADAPMTYAPELPAGASPDIMAPFLLVRSTKNAKKSLKLAEVDEVLLAKWNTETIVLYVQKYGNAMDKSAVFLKAKKTMLSPEKTDRSGAVQSAVVQNLIERLKALHSAEFPGKHISYHLWANWITTQPVHIQERLIEEPPPTILIRHFDLPATDEAVHNRMIIQSNEVAIRQNETAILGFERTLECLQRSKRSLEFAEAEAKGMLHELKICRSVLMDFSVSLQPREVGNSLDLLARVGLQEDVDHA